MQVYNIQPEYYLNQNKKSHTYTMMFLRAKAECFARLCHRLGVCLSICHTCDLYQNGASYDHKIFTVGCPKISSLSWQNSMPLSAGVPLEWGRQRRVPPKKDVILPLLARIMWKRLQIGTHMLLIITSTGDRLFGFININDLERPWTPQKGVFSEFFSIFGCSAHFNTELRRNGWS